MSYQALRYRRPAAGTLRPRRGKAWSRYSDRTFYLFISPWLFMGFVCLTVVPLAYALSISFTNWDGLSGHWHWVGIHNYTRIFSDPQTWHSLQRSLLLMLVTVPLGLAIGLALALLLNRPLAGMGFFRTLFYIPSVVPVVSTAIMFQLLFNTDNGMVNALIDRLGGSGPLWLADPTVFYVLCIMVLWGMGSTMIIFLAGLQGIPAEVIEASEVDGASAWQRLLHVTLPLLSPVLFFQLVMGIIASWQRFVEPMLLASQLGGSSATSGLATSAVPQGNYLYMLHVVTNYFTYQQFGYGSALLWFLFLIVLAVTMLVLKSGAYWVHYEVSTDR